MGRAGTAPARTAAPAQEVNHTIVDVSDVPKVAVGDRAVLFGGEHGDASLSAAEVAKWSSTSVYKTLIETSVALPRRY